MKARVSQLHKTAAEWDKLSYWIPEAGEFIIYDPDETHLYARIKVGDGSRKLSELEFFIDSAVMEVLQKVRYDTVIDGGRITEYAK
jgi:hypothetical protein